LCCRPRIDRFHLVNHHACSQEYGFNIYDRVAHLGSAGINTSAGEGANSRLDKLKKILAFMTGVHATMLLERAIYYWNEDKATRKND
jgi:hypothetical protein